MSDGAVMLEVMESQFPGDEWDTVVNAVTVSVVSQIMRNATLADYWTDDADMSSIYQRTGPHFVRYSTWSTVSDDFITILHITLSVKLEDNAFDCQIVQLSTSFLELFATVSPELRIMLKAISQTCQISSELSGVLDSE